MNWIPTSSSEVTSTTNTNRPFCILIFDLDKTVDAGCMQPGGAPRKKVDLILDVAEKYEWPVYVCTARRLSDFKSERDLLKYNIPQSIVDRFERCNEKARQHRRWLYYTIDDDQGPLKISKFFPHIYDQYKSFLEHNHDVDEGSFQLGILKMLHIEEMIDNHVMEPGFQYRNVYFFDDSYTNKLAWNWFVDNMNHFMKDINFVGGKDKSVFKHVDYEDIEQLIKIIEQIYSASSSSSSSTSSSLQSKFENGVQTFLRFLEFKNNKENTTTNTITNQYQLPALLDRSYQYHSPVITTAAESIPIPIDNVRSYSSSMW